MYDLVTDRKKVVLSRNISRVNLSFSAVIKLQNHPRFLENARLQKPQGSEKRKALKKSRF